MLHCPLGEICRTWTDDCDTIRCIQTHAQGNETCYGHELLAARYRKQLLNLAYQRVGNWDDAEDVVQEAIGRAMRAIHTFRCECSVNTWLWRIVLRTASNLHRSRQSRSAEQLFTDLESPDQHTSCPICDAPDSDAIAVQELVNSAAQTEAIEQALGDLPDDLREILKSHYMDGEPWKEMAHRLDVDEKTLRVRRRRAERLLKSMLERTGWSEDATPAG